MRVRETYDYHSFNPVVDAQFDILETLNSFDDDGELSIALPDISAKSEALGRYKEPRGLGETDSNE